MLDVMDATFAGSEAAAGAGEAATEAGGTAGAGSQLSTSALDALRAGRPIVLSGGLAHDAPVHLVASAELATPELVNLMAREARGLVCLALPARRCAELGLGPMAGAGRSPRAHLVSIEARVGISTGISAADRAVTLRVAAARRAVAGDLVAPGHVIPISASDGGVLTREGQPEAAVDLMRLAGFSPAAVICSVLADDGDVMGVADADALASRLALPVVSLAAVRDARSRRDSVANGVAS